MWFQKLFKSLIESGEHSEFLWGILEWCGLGRPLKALFLLVCTFGGVILVMIAQLPLYEIGLLALGFFALAGVGANAWEGWWKRRKERISHRSPLQIIFDTSNPYNRFWEKMSPRDETGKKLPGVMWEYRVKVQNTSLKTVRNVRISRESSGEIPEMPSGLVFQRDGKQNRDLHPKVPEYVAVLWKFPPQAGDAWGETATAFHGPIKIVASGDDVAPAECEFDYYPDQIPVIVQRGSSHNEFSIP
jgi:hypothetical protein